MSGGRPWREKVCPQCLKRFCIPSGSLYDRVHCSRECAYVRQGERTRRIFAAAKKIGA